MTLLRDWTIKAKLTAILMLTSALAVLLACAGFMIIEYFGHRRILVQDLSILADVTGRNCKAALMFDIPEDATEMLSALAAKPAIVIACVYDDAGNILATYRREDANSDITPPERGEQGHIFEAGHLRLFHNVELDQEVLGTVYLQADLSEIYALLALDTGVLALVALIAAIPAFVLSARLQAIISRPILALADLTRAVSGRTDYSMRAAKESNDEVGLLIDAFNDMLSEIQQRDEALQKTNSYLKLLKTAAIASNEATDVDSAIQAVLDEVCACTGWAMGAAHVRVASIADQAEYRQLWHLDDPERFEPFRTACQNISFETGIGLPGSVFTSGKPVWVPDIQTMVDELPLGDLAVSLGLRSALFLPVLIGAEVVGVLVFSSLQVEEPDRQFLDAIGDIGTQLGRVIERQHAEIALREAHEELEHRVDQRTAELVTAVGQLKDEISEREEAEGELRSSEQRYRAVVEDQTELICRWQPDGRLLFVNDAYCRYFERSREELLGNTFLPVIPDEDHSSVQKHFISLSPASPVATIQHRVFGPAGRVRWHQWTNRAIFDAQGRLSEYQSVGQDITEQRKAEEQVREHRDTLAHLARVSTMAEMATGFAHELNQPLASIVNYAEGCTRRIASGTLQGEQLRGALTEISSEAQRAGEVIRRLRRFVRSRESTQARVEIRQLFEGSLALLRHELHIRGIRTHIEIKDAVSEVLGDSIQLQQVVLNLIQNSMEAMAETLPPRRDITISAATREDNRVTIAVRDCGSGLSEADLSRILEPYYTTKSQGTGMGLAISRTIVEAHGGRLKAAENPDGGCTFQFSLPQYTDA